MATVAQQETGEKRLRGSRCDLCGRIAFPPMAVCPGCGPTHSGAVRQVELPSRGTVVTWTVLHVAPKGFPSPLLHCVLDLGGMKILGTLQGSPEIQSGEVLSIVEDPTERFPFVFTRLTAKST